MRRWTMLLAVLLAGGAVTPAWGQPPGTKPLRLFAEAEDFQIKQGDWQVVPFRENYYASTFAVTFLSRMACLGAPAHIESGQQAVAEQQIVLPRAGTFQVLARYEQPHNFSAEFTVEIVQNGKTVCTAVFGRPEDPKIWAFNGHKRVPFARYFWGGTDNIVWQQQGTVSLQAGPATLRLLAAAQLQDGKPRVTAARRNVDVICLTDDSAGMAAQQKANYLEFDGWLVQAGDLFVRFTNPKDGPGPCVPVVAPEVGGQHSPYYVHIRDWPTTHVLKSGRLTEAANYLIAGPRSAAVAPNVLAAELDPARYYQTDPKNPKAKPKLTIPADEFLQPGERSGWVPLGQVLDALNNCTWSPKAIGKAKDQELHLKLEFAIPDGKGGLKIVKEKTLRGQTETFEMPGNSAPNPGLVKVLQERFWLPVIRTQKEALNWLIEEVGKFPKKGSVPKRFLLYGVMGFGGLNNQWPEAQQLALLLGDNTAVHQEGKKRQLVAHWPDPSMAAIRKKEAELKEKFDDIRIVSYGDETHLPALPVTDEEFAAWLKARGVRYDGPIKIVQRKSAAEAEAARRHPLFYYSQLCMKEKGGRHYAAGTAYYASKGILTGANYSPHSNYLINEMDYVRPFKMKAMTMPWSEDYVWQIPEFSIQATGYLTSGLRAGAKYHNLPIHMYIMPHSPGNTPRDFRLSFYTAVAHGAKMINYFCATPMAVAATENYIATDDLAMFKQVHACSHEAGIFEDYVLDGKVRPARVGLLLSPVDDVLTGSTNSTFAMHNNERKAIYYALRHSQVPVDFVTEDDLIEGLADKYQVIYVTQQWLHSKALAALQKWVEKGGTVAALCGGGFFNEFNQPNPAANSFYGVKHQQIATDPNLVRNYLVEENKPFLTKQDLPVYIPIDKVKWTRGETSVAEVPVIVWKQALQVGDGKLLGTFADGSPAVVEKVHGKGRAILFGFLPGPAYLKSGLPIRPADRGSTDAAFAHFLPTDLDCKLRHALTADFLPRDFVKPVQCSEPLVETTCIDTLAQNGKPRRLAVPLLNFTGRPLAALTVQISAAAAIKSVRSVERGSLPFQSKEGSVIITLPLETADMLLLDY